MQKHTCIWLMVTLQRVVLCAVFCFHADSQLVRRNPEKGVAEARRMADAVPGDVVMVSSHVVRIDRC
jgi:hypothetical protein